MQQKLKKIKNYPKTQKVLQNKKFQKYEKWVVLILWAVGIYFVSSQQLNDLFITIAYFDIFPSLKGENYYFIREQ